MTNPFSSYLATLDDEQRELLQGSIAFVAAVVVIADSTIDRQERKVVEAIRARAGQELGEDFARSSAANKAFDNLGKLAADPNWTGSERVQKLRAVLRAMPADLRKQYARFVVSTALALADASGGVFGMGNKLSPLERYSIRRLLATLDINVEDAAERARLGYDSK